VTVLARLIARVRDRVAARLWRVLVQVLTPAHRAALDDLLTIPEHARATRLELLRRAVTGVNSAGMVRALKRLETIRALEIRDVNLATVPPARLDALARYAILASAATITRMADERRAATLLAFARAIETTAQDDALDLLDALIQDLIRKARLTAQQTRLRTLKDLDAAALQLSTVCACLIDPTYADAEVRKAIYATVTPEQITTAITKIAVLARPPDTTTQPELIARYRMVRRFLPTLLRVLRCDSTAAGRPVFKALAFLRRIEGERDADMRAAPREVVSRT
jgi:hypothetical protein